jgi:hypothetical protein
MLWNIAAVTVIWRARRLLLLPSLRSLRAGWQQLLRNASAQPLLPAVGDNDLRRVA